MTRSLWDTGLAPCKLLQTAFQSPEAQREDIPLRPMLIFKTLNYILMWKWIFRKQLLKTKYEMFGARVRHLLTGAIASQDDDTHKLFIKKHISNYIRDYE